MPFRMSVHVRFEKQLRNAPPAPQNGVFSAFWVAPSFEKRLFYEALNYVALILCVNCLYAGYSNTFLEIFFRFQQGRSCDRNVDL